MSPSHKTHRKVDKMILGKEFPEVHWYKDKPYKRLGPTHRKVRHDTTTNLLLGFLYGSEAFVSGTLHDLTDFAHTTVKKKYRKVHKK